MLKNMHTQRRKAFSLIELVIVVVIIGIIAAIAIPRMSRGASGANDAAVSGNLAVLRKAIDLYTAEHDNIAPTTDIIKQLTWHSKLDGTFIQTRVDGDAYIFGPYLKAIPPLTVGTVNKGQSGIATSGTIGTAGTNGWWYDPATGDIKANCPDTELDAAGKKYNTY